ncbi:MAG: TMEM198/TM7SF3 family protein [Candidatus Hydrogenedentes bacterium]|nr:TMEM198/TM7SF3 family protein [Candidatus Hydrogenedentota bacterium]
MEPTAQLSNIPPLTENGAVAIAIFVGTLYCFLGYRTLKVIICLTGFILAGGMAATLGAYFGQGNYWIAVAAGLIGGLCGAAALIFLFKLGLFMLGMLATALVAHMLLLGRPESWIVFAVLGAGVLGGLLAVALEKFIVILATAAIGAWFTVCGLGYFLIGPKFLDIMQEPLELGRDRTVVAACWATVAIAGALAQFATNRVKREVVVKDAG